ncbi:hypothetical protein C8J56DRAFT_908947 [Mycena floridula]|nr:hypothetical protein C8J56DRAFT_908947 [Mycena floridula]
MRAAIFFFSLVSASVVSAATCALCPTADLAGDALVANSGGTQGVPRFCGFSANVTSGNVEVKCFYGGTGVLSSPSSDALCPPTTSTFDNCPFIP